ncbi:MAG: hypothetical protein S4CHLAM6_08240 [Chlamydiae bacterium]|nr:hypothetical protein [Chlamydiota bacterium]
MNDDSEKFVVAVIAVIVKEDKFLIMKRSAKKIAGPNIWETLSGRVDLGEDPYEAVKREILEECSLEVEVEKRPVDLYMSKRLGSPMLLIVYRANYLSKEVVLSEEHSAYKWASIEEFEAITPLKRLVVAVKKALELDVEVRP